MEWVLFAGEVFLGIALLSASFVLLPFLKKKAANLADKQDIGRITAKVESVKKQYGEQLEAVKAALQAVTDDRIFVIRQERESVLHFFEDVELLLTDKLSVNPADMPVDQLHAYRDDVHQLFTKIYGDYYRMLLYFDEADSLPVATRRVVDGVTDIRLAFKRHFNSVAAALKHEMQLSSTGQVDSESVQATERSNELMKAFWDDMHSAISKTSSAFRKYLSELNSYLGAKKAAPSLPAIIDDANAGSEDNNL